MKSTFSLMLILYMFTAGCNSNVAGEPVEHAAACAAANDGKVVEVSGFLEPRSFMYCSNRGGRMECGFDLKDSPGSDKIVRVDIEQGSSANMAEKLESGFKREDVKIYEAQGERLDLAQKVKVTGKVTVIPPFEGTEGVCFMQIAKIEK